MLIIAFVILYHLSVYVIKGFLERKKQHASIITLVTKTYKYILSITCFVLILRTFSIDVGKALTGLGIIGVGLGFAAQDTLANYIAGITIFWDKPFYVGDYIEVGGLYGRVTEITMRSTRIRTLQNKYLIVPNHTIVNELVINHSKNGEVRVEIPFSISYEDEFTHARESLLSAINDVNDSRLSLYLKPSVVINSLGDNGVEAFLRLWINNAEDQQVIHQEYVELIKDVLAKKGITIPYPQRVMHDGNKK